MEKPVTVRIVVDGVSEIFDVLDGKICPNENLFSKEYVEAVAQLQRMPHSNEVFCLNKKGIGVFKRIIEDK